MTDNDERKFAVEVRYYVNNLTFEEAKKLALDERTKGHNSKVIYGSFASAIIRTTKFQDLTNIDPETLYTYKYKT